MKLTLALLASYKKWEILCLLPLAEIKNLLCQNNWELKCSFCQFYYHKLIRKQARHSKRGQTDPCQKKAKGKKQATQCHATSWLHNISHTYQRPKGVSVTNTFSQPLSLHPHCVTALFLVAARIAGEHQYSFKSPKVMLTAFTAAAGWNISRRLSCRVQSNLVPTMLV